MRSKEERLKEGELTAEREDGTKFIMDPHLEVFCDIAEQLERIADSLEGNKVNVGQTQNSTHLEKILNEQNRK